jgi:Tol biopolymer transport system component
VYRQRVGGGPPEAVTSAGDRFHDAASTISGDGRQLVFRRAEPDSSEGEWSGRWLYGPVGGKPGVLDTTGGMMTPALSPDGRWLAYGGNSPGTMEIFVRRYPNGTPVQVSAGGGIQPVWLAGRSELLYRSRSGDEVFAVGVTGVERPVASQPTRVLRGEFPITYDFAKSRNWDVTPDGRQFVFVLTDAVYLRNAAGMLMGSELRVVPDLIAMVQAGPKKP